VLTEFNGEAKHMHLLVNFPSTVAISRLVNSLRDVSSKRLRKCSRICAGTIGGRNDCGPGRTPSGSVGGAPITVLPVHRAVAPPVLTGSCPAAFTTGLKARALTATSVRPASAPRRLGGVSA